METALSKDCLKVKQIYEKSINKGNKIVIKFFMKTNKAKILFFLFIIITILFVISDFLFKKYSTIYTLVYIPILTIIFLLFMKSLDTFRRKRLKLSKRNYSDFYSFYLLFCDNLNNNMDITVDKAKIIIKQLEVENDNKTPYLSLYPMFFTLIIIPVILNITIPIVLYDIIMPVFNDIIKSIIILLMPIIGVGSLIIAIIFTIKSILNREKDTNEDIIAKLKTYINEEQYNKNV